MGRRWRKVGAAVAAGLVLAAASTSTGRAAVDPDGDGVEAPWDLCPDEAETRNGFEDGDGCPDHEGRVLDALVAASEGLPGWARQALFAWAAEVMTQRPAVTEVTIAFGADADSLYRAERQAEAVVRALVEAGVDRRRLRARGVEGGRAGLWVSRRGDLRRMPEVLGGLRGTVTGPDFEMKLQPTELRVVDRVGGTEALCYAGTRRGDTVVLHCDGRGREVAFELTPGLTEDWREVARGQVRVDGVVRPWAGLLRRHGLPDLRKRALMKDELAGLGPRRPRPTMAWVEATRPCLEGLDAEWMVTILGATGEIVGRELRGPAATDAVRRCLDAATVDLRFAPFEQAVLRYGFRFSAGWPQILEDHPRAPRWPASATGP